MNEQEELFEYKQDQLQELVSSWCPSLLHTTDRQVDGDPLSMRLLREVIQMLGAHPLKYLVEREMDSITHTIAKLHKRAWTRLRSTVWSNVSAFDSLCFGVSCAVSSLLSLSRLCCLKLPLSTPPVSTPPVSTPPVSTPPVSTPPVSTPPVSTPPVSTPPVSIPPEGDGRVDSVEDIIQNSFSCADYGLLMGDAYEVHDIIQTLIHTQ
eukprot:GHVR01087263.1.p1 GENE.GHVR01087263.1~~GHVR01087263.1.p1  ORF type:complete len:208 (+),score=55.47 GHVR01087263.1:113-736(+)